MKYIFFSFFLNANHEYIFVVNLFRGTNIDNIFCANIARASKIMFFSLLYQFWNIWDILNINNTSRLNTISALYVWQFTFILLVPSFKDNLLANLLQRSCITPCEFQIYHKFSHEFLFCWWSLLISVTYILTPEEMHMRSFTEDI